MVSRDQSECLSLSLGDTKTEEVTTTTSTDWSPLQLSSYTLGVPGPGGGKPPPPPVRQTETLDRHLARPGPALRTFNSGRTSAEPLDSCRINPRLDRELQGNPLTPLSASLSELDLRSVAVSRVEHSHWSRALGILCSDWLNLTRLVPRSMQVKCHSVCCYGIISDHAKHKESSLTKD